MPCGGGGIGLKRVDGEWRCHVSTSIARAAFDENNQMLKLGRCAPDAHSESVRGKVRSSAQELKLREGHVEIHRSGEGTQPPRLKIWVEVDRPVIHVQVAAPSPVSVKAAYEELAYQRPTDAPPPDRFRPRPRSCSPSRNSFR